MKSINIVKQKNNKGFSLVELLVTLLVFSMISVIITQILVFNIRSTRSYSDFTTQQFTLQEAYRRLNKDISAATEVKCKIFPATTILTLTIDGTDVEYVLDASRLILNGLPLTDQLSSDSKFEVIDNNLVVTLKAKPTTDDSYAVNIVEPIIAQYSGANKKIILTPP